MVIGPLDNTHIVLDLLSLIWDFGESCTIVPGIISQPAILIDIYV